MEHNGFEVMNKRFDVLPGIQTIGGLIVVRNKSKNKNKEESNDIPLNITTRFPSGSVSSNVKHDNPKHYLHSFPSLSLLSSVLYRLYPTKDIPRRNTTLCTLIPLTNNIPQISYESKNAEKVPPPLMPSTSK